FPDTRNPGRILSATASILVAIQLMSPRLALAAGGSPVSSDPLFSALLVDGRTLFGRIVSLDEAAITLATKQGEKEELRLDRLGEVSPAGSAPRPPRGG